MKQNWDWRSHPPVRMDLHGTMAAESHESEMLDSNGRKDLDVGPSSTSLFVSPQNLACLEDLGGWYFLCWMGGMSL